MDSWENLCASFSYLHTGSKMKLLITFLLFSCLLAANEESYHADTLPTWVKGDFEDDYGIRYNINDSVWTQLPKTRYHILKLNSEEQYVIARNDAKNPSEAGLFTRIDYMAFNNMEPFLWGFCLSVYNAKSDSLAETTYKADRQNPRKGCNGFPFSRMKKAKS
jgi:hypothetical protein